ncbi:MAG TPA: isochorismatase family cysteine hydrolase [Anaerolineaceae bacterium]
MIDHQNITFLEYLHRWLSQRPQVTLTDIIPDPAKAAFFAVDITNGFCYAGALASPRVATIVQPTVDLMTRAWKAGVRHYLLFQDTHEPEATEFSQFPPHCVRGTPEAETVDAIKALPFYQAMLTYPKNSIDSTAGTGLLDWLTNHPEIDRFIVTGDCTDLCTYQLAMSLRLQANAHQLERKVYLPIECVQTYDLSVEVAEKIGAMPHPGDFFHLTFLYHMQLNGIEVIHL